MPPLSPSAQALLDEFTERTRAAVLELAAAQMTLRGADTVSEGDIETGMRGVMLAAGGQLAQVWGKVKP